MTHCFKNRKKKPTRWISVVLKIWSVCNVYHSCIHSLTFRGCLAPHHPCELHHQHNQTFPFRQMFYTIWPKTSPAHKYSQQSSEMLSNVSKRQWDRRNTNPTGFFHYSDKNWRYQSACIFPTTIHLYEWFQRIWTENKWFFFKFFAKCFLMKWRCECWINTYLASFLSSLERASLFSNIGPAGSRLKYRIEN